jgi:hypothetical protein
MEITAILVALLAVIVAIAALAIAAAKGGGVVRYTITGNVEVINDCDGMQASIPSPILIKSALNDNRGQSSGGSATVRLGPDPADVPGTPRLVGNYSITVAWGPGLGNPTNWDTPKATKPDGTGICPSINCPGATFCNDTATRPRVVAFVNPTTTYDLRVQCSCTATP